MSPKQAQTTYDVGDHVQYKAVGGGKGTTSTTQGEIKEVITHKQPAGDRGLQVNASAEDPRYVIRNDNASFSMYMRTFLMILTWLFH
ncbi:hypothetical protein J3R30DRAFT_3697276 [Lentinula aciculospora]|uniref:Hypervirulence associated protein TUDOR domain-containing protein n=1 Tax=Lentinula aciculospora TaxID=153920 RepID=A0A9W9DU95_9AGAR|nr:hypothetical protein J3R30DRAFT_3697276 [Lentinula aciculospora]